MRIEASGGAQGPYLSKKARRDVPFTYLMRLSGARNGSQPRGRRGELRGLYGDATLRRSAVI
jgi:hypothetical protein